MTQDKTINIAGILIRENTFLPPNTVVVIGKTEVVTAKGGIKPNEEGEVKVIEIPHAQLQPEDLEIQFYDPADPVDFLRERLKFQFNR